MKAHKTLAIGSVSALVVGLAGSASAAWTQLDNFESYDNSSNTQTTAAGGGVWTAVFDATNNSHIVDVADGHGQVLEVRGGAAWRGAERSLAGDAIVSVGETQTYFWQVKAFDNSGAYNAGGFYDFMMGLSPNVSNIDDVNAWQDFAVMPFINNSAATPYINAAGPTEPWWALMSTDTWHNVWVVINNDATSPTYDLYMSAGTDPAVLVAENAFWRGTESGIAPGVDLTAIGFMAAANQESRFYIDNIHYTQGEDLSLIPEPGSLALLGLGGLLIARRRRD